MSSKSSLLWPNECYSDPHVEAINRENILQVTEGSDYVSACSVPTQKDVKRSLHSILWHGSELPNQRRCLLHYDCAFSLELSVADLQRDGLPF